jgi:uncharacterized protein (TIGR03435 family)
MPLCQILDNESTLPAFEVASVKSTGAREKCRRGVDLIGPRDSQPGTFVVTNNSLDKLIRWAFRVKEYQVSGPKWLNDDSVCFDIEAKMPPGASRAQLRLMLQNLLAERFKLTIHRETRPLPAYELVTAKGGAKLEPAKAGAKPGISYEGQFWSQIRSQNTTAAKLREFPLRPAGPLCN